MVPYLGKPALAQIDQDCPAKSDKINTVVLLEFVILDSNGAFSGDLEAVRWQSDSVSRYSGYQLPIYVINMSGILLCEIYLIKLEPTYISCQYTQRSTKQN